MSSKKSLTDYQVKNNIFFLRNPTLWMDEKSKFFLWDFEHFFEGIPNKIE